MNHHFWTMIAGLFMFAGIENWNEGDPIGGIALTTLATVVLVLTIIDLLREERRDMDGFMADVRARRAASRAADLDPNTVSDAEIVPEAPRSVIPIPETRGPNP